ncbi:MAG TPA: glycosyltransferase family 39 protein [Candidatus Paceibacterota bacterium]|nr:glycosyltransferase family 39 protein [Candidatus Paceibacterota bacterium]
MEINPISLPFSNIKSIKNIFNKKLIPIFIGLVLIIAALLMLNSSLRESAIVDELAHIPAGYSYLKFGDNRLNPEHPPLLKDLSAIPLVFLNLNFPIESNYWQQYINGQWDVGRVFLYESGNNADQIIQLARIFPMILTLLTAFLVYLLAKKFVGPYWALLPFILFSFSPLFLAHGHYVTTDIAAAFGAILIFLIVIPKMMQPSKKNLLVAGLFLGIAQLTKFSLLLFYPLIIIFILIWKIVQIIKQKKSHLTISPLKEILKTLGNIIIVFIISFGVIYLVYLPQNINYPIEKQVYDTEQILYSFAGGPDPQLETCRHWTGSISRQMRCVAEIDIALSKNKITKPFAQYLLGALMVVERSTGGNTGYFLGNISNSGWHEYFPIVFLIKEPIPSLILIFLAIFWSFKNFIKSTIDNIKNKNWWTKLINWLSQNFLLFCILIFIIIYSIFSIRSPLNIGYRHLTVIIPLIYILTADQIKKWWWGVKNNVDSQSIFSLLINFNQIKKIGIKTILILILIMWYIIEALIISPHFIAYFNEFVGGAKNGYKYVVDSNLDWGQDLKRLAKFVEENNINKIKLDYFGGGSPTYYLQEKFEHWQSAKGQPETNSWLAVSLTFLQNSQGKPVPGFHINPKDTYNWLKDKNPTARIGYSIFVYHF